MSKVFPANDSEYKDFFLISKKILLKEIGLEY